MQLLLRKIKNIFYRWRLQRHLRCLERIMKNPDASTEQKLRAIRTHSLLCELKRGARV